MVGQRARPARVFECATGRRFRKCRLEGVAAIRQAPTGRGAGQPHREQPPQAQRRDAVVQPMVVLGDAAVAHPPVLAGEPGDGPFDHGSVLAVNLLEINGFRLPAGYT